MASRGMLSISHLSHRSAHGVHGGELGISPVHRGDEKKGSPSSKRRRFLEDPYALFPHMSHHHHADDEAHVDKVAYHKGYGSSPHGRRPVKEGGPSPERTPSMRKVDAMTAEKRAELLRKHKEENDRLSHIDSHGKGGVGESAHVGDTYQPTHESIDEVAASMPPFRIHPNSKYKSAWDLIIMAVISYSVVVVPYRLAFSVVADKRSLSFIFDCSFDILFAIDIGVNFRTCYECEETLLMVTDFPSIARRYLRTWFTIDFLSTVPFDLLGEAVLSGSGDSSGDEASSLRVTKLLRSLRMFKVSLFVVVVVVVVVVAIVVVVVVAVLLCVSER